MSNVKTNPMDELLLSISSIGKMTEENKKETDEAIEKLKRCDKDCMEFFSDAFGVDETEKK